MARKTETPVAPKTPLGQARAALQAGNTRLAHKLASEAAATGPEGEREEAQKLERSLAPDPQPLMVVAAVLILIIVAAWLAILRKH